MTLDKQFFRLKKKQKKTLIRFKSKKDFNKKKLNNNLQ